MSSKSSKSPASKNFVISLPDKSIILKLLHPENTVPFVTDFWFLKLDKIATFNELHPPNILTIVFKFDGSNFERSIKVIWLQFGTFCEKKFDNDFWGVERWISILVPEGTVVSGDIAFPFTLKIISSLSLS